MLKNLRTRIVESFRDPHMRANVLALVGGKIIGLALLLSVMVVFLPPVLHAQAGAPSPEINALNTVWVLLAAFLVFCMQVGFVMLEAGFARSRESINILVEGIVDTCICGVLFWAWGFAFMFEPGNGFIGTTGFFLQGLPETYGSTGIPLLAFWVFQFAFADTCSTITSGAMVGRCGFVGDILYSIGVTGFIYPIIGHWGWGPMAGWRCGRWHSGTSPAQPWCTRSVARSLSSARLRSARGLGVCSVVTAGDRRFRTTSFLARSAG